MVVNKNPSATITAEISFAGYTPAATATQYFYGMPQDNAAMNGQAQSIAISQISNVANTTTLTFPPYSVSVLVFTPKGSLGPKNPTNPLKPLPSSKSAR
jgi:hypothetical protein